jgi:hypothetical protein
MARRPARATKLLNEMRRNPRGDWRIQQLESVARGYEVNARQGRGSHVVFEHASLIQALSVPARRPIKPVYVRRFVALIESIEAIEAEEATRKGITDDEL